MMGYYGNMFGWGGGGFMLIFWVAVILLIVWVVKELAGKSGKGSSDSALESLRQRYAKGEINKEEFDAKKKDLST
ncbi:MAG: SHOCT domain-containing protein [Candidatus Doudnabacteria bacterium]|jgi:putative membrane protein